MEGTEQDLTARLAREVVSDQAAEELPLFRTTAEAYFDTPDSVLRRVVGRDDPLGFGADAVVSLTPFALAVASTVVGFLGQQALLVAQELGRDVVRDVLRGWFSRLTGSEPDASVPSLNARQLAQVRAVAYEKACQLGLSDDQGQLLADAIGGSLIPAH